MSRIVHFELPAENPEELMQFYTSCFGWQFDKWGEEDYWLAKTGDTSDHGIDGAIVKRKAEGHTLVNTIDVEDIDSTVKKIIENGGEIVQEKVAVRTVGWLISFKDKEGNLFSVMQSDAEAK
jgi:predicted enzyme related to lactoylglutathione lyase